MFNKNEKMVVLYSFGYRESKVDKGEDKVSFIYNGYLFFQQLIFSFTIIKKNLRRKESNDKRGNNP